MKLIQLAVSLQYHVKQNDLNYNTPTGVYNHYTAMISTPTNIYTELLHVDNLEEITLCDSRLKHNTYNLQYTVKLVLRECSRGRKIVVS